MSEEKDALSLLLATKGKPPAAGKKTARVSSHEVVETISEEKVRYASTKHPTNVPGWDGSLAELAAAIENMRYDKTVEFLSHLARCFSERSKKDLEAGRLILGNALYNASHRTVVVKDYVLDAWKICEPYMRLK